MSAEDLPRNGAATATETEQEDGIRLRVENVSLCEGDSESEEVGTLEISTETVSWSNGRCEPPPLKHVVNGCARGVKGVDDFLSLVLFFLSLYVCFYMGGVQQSLFKIEMFVCVFFFFFTLLGA